MNPPVWSKAGATGLRPANDTTSRFVAEPALRPAESGLSARLDHDTGTVVSAKAAWSGTVKRATPAALVVTLPTTEFVPSPVAFQTARLNTVFGGSPPTLYGDDASGEAVFKSRPRVSSPMIVSSPFGPE